MQILLSRNFVVIAQAPSVRVEVQASDYKIFRCLGYSPWFQVFLGSPELGRREKTPTLKTRFSIWTLLRTPGRFTTRLLPVHFTTKMSVVRPFSVLSKDELALSKTGRFLSKAEILGVGVFSPLPKNPTIAAKIITKNTLQKNCFGRINLVKKLQINHFTKQISSHALLQTGTNQWQQHYKQIFWWNNFRNNFKDYYKNNCSMELFCNNFGQDGTFAEL